MEPELKKIAFCIKCDRMQLLKSFKHEPYWSTGFYSGHMLPDYYWDVTFSCGHVARTTGVFEGEWCSSCSKWELKRECCAQTKREEMKRECREQTDGEKMTWDGSRFWLVIDSEGRKDDVCMYSSVVDAKAEASRCAAKENRIFFVMESVGGYQPQDRVEPIKFKE